MSLKIPIMKKMYSRLKKTKSKGVQKKENCIKHPKILEIDTVSNLSPNLSVLFILYVYYLFRKLPSWIPLVLICLFERKHCFEKQEKKMFGNKRDQENERSNVARTLKKPRRSFMR